jgi:hypothetical protein
MLKAQSPLICPSSNQKKFNLVINLMAARTLGITIRNPSGSARMR